MKARCITLLDERGGPMEKSPWLTVGKLYDILGIYVPFGGPPKFRVVGDDGSSVALHDALQFEITSSLVPSEWKIHVASGKLLIVEPAPWLAPGFWEAYFNFDAVAQATFKKSYDRMIEEQSVDQNSR